MTRIETDYLIVGSGIAGLITALRLARHGRVLVITKKASAESNTNYAQGGIASVVSPVDSFETHVRDTLDAGAGLCDEAVVRHVINRGPGCITELESFGIAFTERRGEHPGEYDRGKEGGHSRRRVLHVGDMTGRRIEKVLLDRVQAEANIRLLEHCMAIDLVTTSWLAQRAGAEPLGPGPDDRCVGLYTLDRRKGEVMAVHAPYTILATGGGGKVYLYTSNPDIATGDGVAMAWRAGVPIRNMEFIQFHPTCLYHPEAKSFLVSEAVRGEGAKLVDAQGTSFMEGYDERGALAPRDVVARAIDREMKTTGAECVFLDIRHRSRAFLLARFPNIYEACLGYGVDMATDLIPVVPAAHYFCGGIRAGVDGTTDLPGLFACGETACTGLHGANRLASNSLLEAVVSADETAAKIVSLPPPADWPPAAIPDWEPGAAVPSDEQIVVEHNWNELRTCMWDYVGIVRSDKRLERAWRRIWNLRQEIRQYYLDYLVTADVLELRNIAAVAELVVRSAMQRRESRGLHYTLDHAEPAPAAEETVIHDPPGARI